MTAAQSAEAQARLNVQLKEIVTFFEEAGIEEHSVILLNSFIDKHLTSDILNPSEGDGNCMRFIDHDELINKLRSTYQQLIDGYVIERKIINKRIRLLKEDKKADPDGLARQENALIDVDMKKALAMTAFCRIRAMSTIPLEKFHDPKFDGLTFYRKAIEHQKQLLKKEQKEAALSRKTA